MLGKTLEYGKIQILDRALPNDLHLNLVAVTQQIGWQFGWNTPSNPGHRYWHHEVGGGSKRNTQDVSGNVRKHPLRIFGLYQDWLRCHLVPPETKVLRFYLNAHTYGTDGWPHTDTDRTDELTLVLYLNQEWRPEWCGETVVFDKAGEIQASVLPRANRMLSFPSDQLHAPRPLSKAFEGLRSVLVVKLGPAEPGQTFGQSAPVLTERERSTLGYLQNAGAGKVPHSGRSLLRHLWGIYRLLRLRGAAQEVCDAALFHSVYGTSVIKIDIQVQRDQVRNLIGERAERLAWLFCKLQRPECWRVSSGAWPLADGNSIEISAQDQQDLRLIERANLDEQRILTADRQVGVPLPSHTSQGN